MLKIQLKSGAAVSAHGTAYGYGRVYHSLVKYLEGRAKLVKTAKEADVQVCLTLPAKKWKYFHWWGKEKHPVQIIYTMWETTRIPTDFVDVINRASALFVPSFFCQSVFKECGVVKPIHIVPHGVDQGAFPYIERNWNDVFIYLWQGMNPYDRKGLVFVREAWKQLKLKDAILVEKTYPVASRGDMPIIRTEDNRVLIYRFLSGKDYRSLLAQCHVSVNPFRGEGFALMPLETASTGMATILTNWSGAVDYIRDNCFWPLKYRLSKPGDDFFNSSIYVQDFRTPPAQDAIPDIEHLKEAMIYFYTHRDEAREMGVRAHKYIKKEWTWERAVDIFLTSVEKVLTNAV